jgi:drug/metabolite transporter (DMT)-like permease
VTEPARAAAAGSGARGDHPPHRFDAALAWYFVLVWGAGYIATRLGLLYAPPFTFLSLRFGAAALCMLVVVVIVRPRWPASIVHGTGGAAGRGARLRMQIAHLIAAGLLMHAINLGASHYAQYLGLAAGTSALVLAAQLLLTAAIAGPLLGQPPSARQWLGVIIGLAGVALLVAHKFNLAEVNAANLAAVSISLLAITAGTLYQRHYCPETDLRLALLVQLVASWLVVTPLAIAIEGFSVVWAPGLFAALAFLVVLASILANIALHTLMRHGEATRVTSLMYLTPIIAVVLERWIFGVVPSALTLLGGAVTCLGVALASWRVGRPAPPGGAAAG